MPGTGVGRVSGPFQQTLAIRAAGPDLGHDSDLGAVAFEDKDVVRDLVLIASGSRSDRLLSADVTLITGRRRGSTPASISNVRTSSGSF